MLIFTKVKLSHPKVYSLLWNHVYKTHFCAILLKSDFVDYGRSYLLRFNTMPSIGECGCYVQQPILHCIEHPPLKSAPHLLRISTMPSLRECGYYRQQPILHFLKMQRMDAMFSWQCFPQGCILQPEQPICLQMTDIRTFNTFK